MTSQPVIRLTTPVDIPKLRALAKLVFQDTLPWVHRMIHQLYDAQIVAYEIDDAIVGMVITEDIYYEDMERYDVCPTILEAICVHPDYRRQGIGSKLIQAIRYEAYEPIYVNNVLTRDIPFYTSAGFKTVRIGKDTCHICTPIIHSSPIGCVSPPCQNCDGIATDMRLEVHRTMQLALPVDGPALHAEVCENVDTEIYEELSKVQPGYPFIRHTNGNDVSSIWDQGTAASLYTRYGDVLEICRDHKGCVYVVDEVIVGFLLMNTISLERQGSADPPKDVDVIISIWVHPAFRRQGIARQLVKVAIDRTRGPVYLHAKTSSVNAKGFYISEGFEPVSTVDRVSIHIQRRHPRYMIHTETKDRDLPPPLIHTIRLIDNDDASGLSRLIPQPLDSSKYSENFTNYTLAYSVDDTIVACMKTGVVIIYITLGSFMVTPYFTPSTLVPLRKDP